VGFPLASGDLIEEFEFDLLGIQMKFGKTCSKAGALGSGEYASQKRWHDSGVLCPFSTNAIAGFQAEDFHNRLRRWAQ
jgi:hypothetical protein